MTARVRIDPFGETVIDDYGRLFDLFGMKPVKPLLRRIANPHKYLQAGLAFGHRDLETVLEAIDEGRPFAVMSGIKPSNTLHLGSKKIMDMLIHFQRLGGHVFYSIADLEAHVDNGLPLKTCERIAVDNIADLLALGLDTKRAYVYRQSTEQRVKNLAYSFGRKVTLNTMRAIYGDRNIGLYLAALTQAGDILLPQLKDFGGPKPTLVPIGVDNDPHLRLTRDIAGMFSAYNFIKPSCLILKLTSSLTGQKMSKRSPDSCVFLNDSDVAVTRKIMNALTGGRATVADQRELGGEPERCPVYEIYAYIPSLTYNDLVQIHEDCRQGHVLCGECKQRCALLMREFLEEHGRRRSRVMAEAEEIVVNQRGILL